MQTWVTKCFYPLWPAEVGWDRGCCLLLTPGAREALFGPCPWGRAGECLSSLATRAGAEPALPSPHGVGLNQAPWLVSSDPSLGSPLGMEGSQNRARDPSRLAAGTWARSPSVCLGWGPGVSASVREDWHTEVSVPHFPFPLNVDPGSSYSQGLLGG